MRTIPKIAALALVALAMSIPVAPPCGAQEPYRKPPQAVLDVLKIP